MKMLPADKIDDLYQELIQGLDADLESGSHHWNNLAWERHQKRYKYFWEAMHKFGQYLLDNEDSKGG